MIKFSVKLGEYPEVTAIDENGKDVSDEISNEEWRKCVDEAIANIKNQQAERDI
jgi:hypothetical protein